MRYIKNPELREWVKESLRKAIFQKAHSLAIQTGCEVLVKLDDVVDAHESQYYATHTLEKAYDSNQLQKSSNDVLVCGETGLPVAKMIDQASQSSATIVAEEEDQSDFGSDWEDLSPGGAIAYNDDGVHNLSTERRDNVDSCSDKRDVCGQEVESRQKVEARQKDMSEMYCDKVLETEIADRVDEIDKDTQMKVESMDVTHQGNQPNYTRNSTAEFNPSGEGHIEALDNSTSSVESSDGMMGTASEDDPSPDMSPSIRPYQCGVCQKTFGSIQVLTRHAQTFHGMDHGVRYYCNICGQSYKLAQYLQAHVKMHDTVSVMPVLCKVCGMGYYSDAALRRHEISHSEPVLTTKSLPHTMTSPDKLIDPRPDLHLQPSDSTTIPIPPNSTTISVPSEVPFQAKPNPRLHLSQSTQSSQLPPTVKPLSETNESSTHQSHLEAKRFKSGDDEVGDNEGDNFHEPKQYHCLVCGMAFEEGEQLEAHVMRKHMQSDAVPLPTDSSLDKTPHLPQVDNDQTQVKEEAMSPPESSRHSDQDLPSTSESSLSGLNPAFQPFGAFNKGGFMMPPFSQPMSFPPLPPPESSHSSNANITSVLEKALPGLLPGISLLSNPTQLPMAQAAATIARSENHPPMVSQDGRFTCDICGNSYKYNCTLKEHRLTHAQTPLFSCKICNQAFSRQRQLRDHMFRHSGAYPYHCKLCGKGFVRPSILRRHETDRHKQAWENMS